ncbi:hypothetical protein ACHAWF_004098 [Thalassiosira exigua]
MEGSRARFEKGIDKARIEYRKAKTIESNAPPTKETTVAPPESEKKEGIEQPSPLEVHPSEELVPSSITCDSASKNHNSSKESPGSAIKDAKTPASPPCSSNNPKKRPREGTTQTDNSLQSPRSASNRPVDRDLKEIPKHQTSRDIMLPLWLQRGEESRRQLLRFLVGSKTNGIKGVSNIGQKFNCDVKVNSNMRGQRNLPMTITINALSQRTAFRDQMMVREAIQQQLLEYMDIGRDGSRGRLFYEIAGSCGGPHRPKKTINRVVKTIDPFRVGTSWMCVLELPFEIVEGRKEYHAAYLLRRDFRNKLRDCNIKVFGGDFGRSTRYCDPYVFVTGPDCKGLDRAVDIVKDDIARHMRYCSCRLCCAAGVSHSLPLTALSSALYEPIFIHVFIMQQPCWELYIIHIRLCKLSYQRWNIRYSPMPSCDSQR